MKKKVLLMAKLPPPTTGATIMNKVIIDSTLINYTFDTRVISVNFPKNTKDFGRYTIGKILKVFKYAFILIREIISFKPDLVYFTLTQRGPVFFRDAFYVLIMKIFRKKIIIHLHGIGIDNYSKKSKIYNYVYKRTFKNTSLICLSHLVAPDVNNVYDEEPFAINYGIEDYYPKLKDKMQESDKIRILFLSNYMKMKGVFDFIEMMEYISGKSIDFQAKMIGSPTDISVDELKEYVKEKNLEDKVQVVGPVYGDDKFVEFLNSDIYVFPTLWESFGVVALEAMQFNLPIVASRVGSLPHIVSDNETGFLAEKGNVKDFSEKIITLIEDDELRQKFGKNARDRFVELFIQRKFEENIQDAFIKTLEQ